MNWIHQAMPRNEFLNIGKHKEPKVHAQDISTKHQFGLRETRINAIGSNNIFGKGLAATKWRSRARRKTEYTSVSSDLYRVNFARKLAARSIYKTKRNVDSEVQNSNMDPFSVTPLNKLGPVNRFKVKNNKRDTLADGNSTINYNGSTSLKQHTRNDSNTDEENIINGNAFSSSFPVIVDVNDEIDSQKGSETFSDCEALAFSEQIKRQVELSKQNLTPNSTHEYASSESLLNASSHSTCKSVLNERNLTFQTDGDNKEEIADLSGNWAECDDINNLYPIIDCEEGESQEFQNRTEISTQIEDVQQEHFTTRIIGSEPQSYASTIHEEEHNIIYCESVYHDHSATLSDSESETDPNDCPQKGLSKRSDTRSRMGPCGDGDFTSENIITECQSVEATKVKFNVQQLFQQRCFDEIVALDYVATNSHNKIATKLQSNDFWKSFRNVKNHQTPFVYPKNQDLKEKYIGINHNRDAVPLDHGTRHSSLYAGKKLQFAEEQPPHVKPSGQFRNCGAPSDNDRNKEITSDTGSLDNEHSHATWKRRTYHNRAVTVLSPGNQDNGQIRNAPQVKSDLHGVGHSTFTKKSGRNANRSVFLHKETVVIPSRKFFTSTPYLKVSVSETQATRQQVPEVVENNIVELVDRGTQTHSTMPTAN